MTQVLLNVALEHLEREREVGAPAFQPLEERELEAMRVRVVVLLAEE
jgi:hypothetical protein